MYNAMEGFLYFVSTFYSLYKYADRHNNMFKEAAIIQFQWLVYYNVFTVIILMISYMLKNEVCKVKFMTNR